MTVEEKEARPSTDLQEATGTDLLADLTGDVIVPVTAGSSLMRSTSQGKALTLEARIQSIKCNYKSVASQSNKNYLFKGKINSGTNQLPN